MKVRLSRLRPEGGFREERFSNRRKDNPLPWTKLPAAGEGVGKLEPSHIPKGKARKV
jgi:hypothetical protein